MERNVESVANDLLDSMVSRKSGCIHVIERGHTGKSGIAKQNEEVAVQTVEENDGHDFEDDSHNILNEAEEESVDESNVPAILLGRPFMVIIFECFTLEVLRMIHDVFHRVQSVSDLSCQS